MGEFHVGVRASNLRIHQLLVATLQEHLVSDPLARPSYAILESPSSISTARPLVRVFRDCNNIFTARSVERAVSFLAAQLEQHLPYCPPPVGAIDLDVVALLGPRSALLAPGTTLSRYPDLELRLGRGLRILEFPRVWVDAAAAAVVVPPRQLSVLRPGDGSKAGREHSVTTPPGTIELGGWIFLQPDGPSDPMPRALAVARGLLAANRQNPREALQLLASLIAQLQVVSVRDGSDIPRIARSKLGGTP